MSRASSTPPVFSPRTWRCFFRETDRFFRLWVFSTHVEMFRSIVSATIWRRKFSPRTWRCFLGSLQTAHSIRVFSTHVEMFLHDFRPCREDKSFLHACGDVSKVFNQPLGVSMFSPRTWRVTYVILNMTTIHWQLEHSMSLCLS